MVLITSLAESEDAVVLPARCAATGTVAVSMAPIKTSEPPMMSRPNEPDIRAVIGVVGVVGVDTSGDGVSYTLATVCCREWPLRFVAGAIFIALYEPDSGWLTWAFDLTGGKSGGRLP